MQSAGQADRDPRCSGDQVRARRPRPGEVQPTSVRVLGRPPRLRGDVADEPPARERFDAHGCSRERGKAAAHRQPLHHPQRHAGESGQDAAAADAAPRAGAPQQPADGGPQAAGGASGLLELRGLPLVPDLRPAELGQHVLPERRDAGVLLAAGAGLRPPGHGEDAASLPGRTPLPLHRGDSPADEPRQQGHGAAEPHEAAGAHRARRAHVQGQRAAGRPRVLPRVCQPAARRAARGQEPVAQAGAGGGRRGCSGHAAAPGLGGPKAPGLHLLPERARGS
mmetsp:Transcript_104070/g.324453  ORF Transcript_104070/g.324453 Transcript_104070/m.324453 type:complete len:280 (+) Transcript_104070:357-1196(+)